MAPCNNGVTLLPMANGFQVHDVRVADLKQMAANMAYCKDLPFARYGEAMTLTRAFDWS
jgi:hypothetical protein